eukprot:TRINITY_DN72167_c0_g1_i1.p1 TRINITY_DN72167_c0_g1~~TRINITY_DN72167_c0_g1_i1.p1  ORF type:complete len:475 (+),score=131.48 TRINITY_DN72167_c0_g1_i1:81-1505(+)
MAAAHFSDDAFNKNCVEGPGTLIGNWYEERVHRDFCGEGRALPQRHLPRRDLLKDWTKVPSGGPRKQDNTFERIYGPAMQVHVVPQSKRIGAGEDDIFRDTPIAPTLQASGRIPREGQKSQLAEAAYHEAAEASVRDEEALLDEAANQRYMDTTVGTHFQRPDESQVERPEYLRKSCRLEILHGAATEHTRTLNNKGLEIPGHTHYSNMETLTHQRMSMDDPRTASDVKASAASGVNTFGKNSEFTTPVGDCLLGLSKDEEVDNMYKSLKKTDPLRTLGGSEVRGASFQGVPSLAALKQQLHNKVAQVWGNEGYVILRQKLFDRSDEEGFIRRDEAAQLLREELGLSAEEVSDKALSTYLGQMVTMKKDQLHVGALMSSLRPSLPLALQKRVHETFDRFEPVDGAVRLGSWLGTVAEPQLQQTLATAFGGSPEDADAVADQPITKPIFMELISDLAPLTKPDDLLPKSWRLGVN